MIVLSLIHYSFCYFKVLLASCYIPFYAGLTFPEFKGQVSNKSFIDSFNSGVMSNKGWTTCNM